MSTKLTAPPLRENGLQACGREADIPRIPVPPQEGVFYEAEN